MPCGLSSGNFQVVVSYFLCWKSAHNTGEACTMSGEEKKVREPPVHSSVRGILSGWSFTLRLLHFLPYSPGKTPIAFCPQGHCHTAWFSLFRWWASQSIFSPCCHSFPHQPLHSLKHFWCAFWNCLQWAENELPQAKFFVCLSQEDVCMVVHQSHSPKKLDKEVCVTPLLLLSHNKNRWSGPH